MLIPLAAGLAVGLVREDPVSESPRKPKTIGTFEATPPPKAAVLRTHVIGPVYAHRSGGPNSEVASLEEFHRRRVEVFIATSGFGPRRVVPSLKMFRWPSVRLKNVTRHVTSEVFLGTGGKRMLDDYAAAHDGVVVGKLRAPNAWEAKALAAMRDGEDVVAIDNKRFAGAIRAHADCARCHKTEEGALLGAFVYELGGSPVLASGN